MTAGQAAPVELVSETSAARVRRAASGQTSPGELRELTADPDILVRAAVAINRSCAPEVEAKLARDQDERVRALLGGRIARLLPDLAGPDTAHATAHALATLIALAQDEAVRVRAAIADAVKEMPEAPRELILRLANDPKLEVSDPVLRLSPVLTDADLLALVATPPNPCAAVAIAARPGLSASITDAIAAHACAPAIEAMLANGSASIKEATLDALIERAPSHEHWHGPLVRRPALSNAAARALSSFVAAQYLEVLAQRTDLDPAAIQFIRQQLAARLNEGGCGEMDDRALIIQFLRLKKGDDLSEAVLLRAARAGEVRRIAAILSVACEVALSAIDRAVALRSSKAMVSLAWRAGFSMQAAMAVQAVLGQLGSANTLGPARDGGFPLSEDEMRWQLELLQDTGQKAAAPEFRRAAVAVPAASAAL